MTHLPFFVFFLTGITVFGVITFRYFIPFSRAVSKLETVHRNEGKTWSYPLDLKFRKTLFSHPEKIIEDSDSHAVRSAKEELLVQREKMWSTILIGICILIIGFVLTAVAGYLSFAFAEPQ